MERTTTFRAVNIQGWHDLTFLHWSYPAEIVQALLPPPLRVETAEGRAWVGITPFRMYAVRPVGLPPVPHLSFFPEVNCRTYVQHPNGTSGIWFFSLDTPRLWIVAALRALGLPYMWARMEVAVDPPVGPVARRVSYRVRRLVPRPTGTVPVVRPGEPEPVPLGEPEPVPLGGQAPVPVGGPEPGAPAPAHLRAAVEVGRYLDRPDPLTVFLTARWWAFTSRAGRLWQVPVTHPDWPLYRASAVVADADGLLRAARLPVPPDSPLVHFSPGVRTRLGLPRPS